MKRRGSFFILIIFCSSITLLHAQKGGYDYILQKKIEFLVLNMDLTIEESQTFWPVYNEYSAKKSELSKEYKEKYEDAKKLQNATEEEYRKTIEGMMANRINQAILLREYSEKYLKVLSAEKVYKLFALEEEFNKNLMRQLRKPPADIHKDSGPTGKTKSRK